MILRKGTRWIVERARDLRQNNKTCFLEEEAEVLVALFLPEKAAYKVESLAELSPELVDQLLQHVDDLIISGPLNSSLGSLRRLRNTSLSATRTRTTLRSRDSVFVGFLMHRVTRSISRSIRSCACRSWKRLSSLSILRMLMCVTRLSTLRTDPCLVASTGFSRGRNSRHAISSLVWHQHPLLQPLVTAKS